jgi:PAS domain S-box-containing protein
MAENIDQVFWMFDVNINKILYVSPAFEKVWGRNRADFDRQVLLTTVHPEDRDRVSAFLKTNTSEATEEFYRIIRPDGAVRSIHDRAFPVLNQDGKLYRVAGLAEDITDQKELEAQLRQAQKMEAVGRLAGGIAHDFNNLLTIIGGYAHMLRESTPVDDPRRESLELILSASNRGSTLTSQLLAFSRRQVLQPKLIQLNNLLTNMDALLRRVMGEHITLHSSLCSDSPWVKADPNQLEQVLINLAANARDAMPNGGQFKIETAIADAPDIGAGNGFAGGKCVRLRISDTGCGMDSRILQHAFEPFFTTKDVGKGTGLGLSTVYGIVAQNHGAIRVSSEQGHGTAFEIFLPIAHEEKAEEHIKTGSQDPSARWRGNETILIVEDEPDVRRLARETLERLGYDVLHAADGYEALRIIEQHPDPVHLLLTDVIMPLMNGPELAKRVKSARSEITVLYMSGYTDDTLAFHGLAQPDVNFIQKPFTPGTLAEKLRNVLSENGQP